MAKQKEANPLYGKKVVSGECFASFPHLVAPNNRFAKKGTEGDYMVDAIFIDKDQMKTIVDECKDVVKRNFPEINPKEIKWPWKSGDEGSTSKYQGYPGRYFISPKTATEIPVVGPNPKIGMDPAKIYGGAIIKVNVTPKGYIMDKDLLVQKPDGTKVIEKIKQYGVTLYLNGVQFIRDSDRFGGGEASGESMFANESGTEESADDVLNF